MSTAWFYAKDDRQQGPVSEDEFRDLVSAGTIAGDTLVWREPMPDWLPLHQVADAPRPPVPAADATAPGRCAWCGGAFAPEAMIVLAGRTVCAACKPIALQRLEEGLGLPNRGRTRPTPVDPDALIAEIRARGFEVKVGETLGRAWELYKRHFWPCVGASSAIILLSQVIGMIPFVGVILSLVLQGPLFAGLYMYFLKIVRQQPAQIGDAFGGFNPEFWRYMLTYLIVMLPSLVVALIVVIPVLLGAVFIGASGGPGNGGEPGTAFLLVVLPAVLIAVLAGMYFQLILTFALPLAADLQLGPVNAAMTSLRVVHMRFGSILLLVLATALIVLAGFLALIVGVFFTLPLFWLAMMVLYEEIFAPRDGAGPTSAVAPA